MTTRRDFLKGLGAGVALAAVPAVLVPERRIYQVPRGAPFFNVNHPDSVDWYTRERDWIPEQPFTRRLGECDADFRERIKNNIYCADPDRVKDTFLPGGWEDEFMEEVRGREFTHLNLKGVDYEGQDVMESIKLAFERHPGVVSAKVAANHDKLDIGLLLETPCEFIELTLDGNQEKA